MTDTRPLAERVRDIGVYLDINAKRAARPGAGKINNRQAPLLAEMARDAHEAADALEARKEQP
ncbi:MAG: hypothetical protein WCO83_02290 [Alphaproteobacteria bacterium]